MEQIPADRPVTLTQIEAPFFKPACENQVAIRRAALDRRRGVSYSKACSSGTHMKLLIIIIDCSSSIGRRRRLFDVGISETGLAPEVSPLTFGFSLPVRGWFERARLWRAGAFDGPHRTIRVALDTTPRRQSMRSVRRRTLGSRSGQGKREKEGKLRKQEHERLSAGEDSRWSLVDGHSRTTTDQRLALPEWPDRVPAIALGAQAAHSRTRQQFPVDLPRSRPSLQNGQEMPRRGIL